MAGNANRNVSVDITGDSRDLEASYDRSSRKSDEMAKKQDDNNKKTSDSFKKMSEVAGGGVEGLLGLFSNLGKSGPLAIGAAVAALALIGPAANIAAGGVTLVLGAALAGIGIIAASQSAVVRGQFKALWDEVKNDTIEMSGPIRDALYKIPDYASFAFQKFKPELDRAFQTLGPAIDRFGLDFSQAFVELAPAIEPLSRAFATLLAEIGQDAPEMFGHLENAITTLAGLAEKHASQISGFITTIFQLIEGTAIGLSKMSETWDGALASWEDGINGIIGPLSHDTWSVNISNTTDRWNTMGESLKRTAALMETNKTATDNLAVSTDTLKLAIEGLNNEHLNGDMAASKYREAFDKARETVDANRGAIDWYTASGRKNYDTIFTMVQASQKLILAKSEEGATTSQLTGLYQTHRNNLTMVAKEMGLNEKEAKELVDRYLTIPKDINTKIKANTSDAQRGVDEFITLNSGRQIPVYLIQKQEMGAKDGGYIGYASGGPVRGPGGSRTDSIPARISRGEFVVNAAATRRNLPLLEAINSGKGVGGMGGTTVIYQVNTSVAPTANLASVGAEIVTSIQAFENYNGSSWRRNN